MCCVQLVTSLLLLLLTCAMLAAAAAACCCLLWMHAAGGAAGKLHPQLRLSMLRASLLSHSPVPREAVLEIDVRDIDGPRRDGVLASIKAEAQAIAARRKVGGSGTV